MVEGLIQLAERCTQSLTQSLHHTLNPRDVVVGGANKGKEAFCGILTQHSHTCKKTKKCMFSLDLLLKKSFA